MVWDPETNGTKEQMFAAHAARLANAPPRDPREVRRINISVTIVCLTSVRDTFTAEELIREYGEMGVGEWEGGLAAVEELIALDVIRRTDAGLVMGDADMSVVP